MKKTLSLLLLLVFTGCASTPTNSSLMDEESVVSGSSQKDQLDNCCAHWVGDSCVHELIPGCSTNFIEPLDDMTGDNCAHIGADGTCHHPM